MANEDALILQALSSTENRLALETAIADYVDQHVSDFSVARKVLPIDVIGEAHLPMYEALSPYGTSLIATGKTQSQIISGAEQLLLPYFEIASFVKSDMSAVKSQPKAAFLNIRNTLATSQKRQEEALFLNMLNAAAKENETVCGDNAHAYNEAMKLIEQHDMIVTDCVCFSDLKNSDTLDLLGGSVKQYGCDLLKKGVAFFICNVNLGVLAMKNKTMCLPADVPQEWRFGSLAYVEAGIGIFDTKCIVKVSIDPDDLFAEGFDFPFNASTHPSVAPASYKEPVVIATGTLKDVKEVSIEIPPEINPYGKEWGFKFIDV